MNTQDIFLEELKRAMAAANDELPEEEDLEEEPEKDIKKKEPKEKKEKEEGPFEVTDELVQEMMEKFECDCDPEQFKKGLEVEQEHGSKAGDFNLTKDDPETTAKIVLAHLQENPEYYTKLEQAGL